MDDLDLLVDSMYAVVARAIDLDMDGARMGQVVHAACLFAERVVAVAEEAKPRVQLPAAGEAAEHSVVERFVCARLLHMALVSAHASIDVAMIAAGNPQLASVETTQGTVATATEGWYDDVLEPLSLRCAGAGVGASVGAQVDTAERLVDGALDPLIRSFVMMHSAQAAHVLRLAPDAHLVQELLSDESVFGSSVHRLSNYVVRGVTASGAGAEEALDAVRFIRKDIRVLDMVRDLISLAAPPPPPLPDALASALAAAAELAQRVAPLLHPAVAATLLQQPTCPVCDAALDVYNMQVSRCWRPRSDEGGDGSSGCLHCICSSCKDHWELTCTVRRVDVTCPLCRASTAGAESSYIVAEDVAAWLRDDDAAAGST